MTAPHRTPVSDDAVSRLPLGEGRAALLEEIVMSTPVLDRPRSRRTDRAVSSTRRWVAPVAAAAAVALVAAVGAAASHWSQEPTTVSPSPVPLAVAPPASPADRLLLEAPGWEVEHVDAEGGASWARGRADLEVSVRPAETYDGYVQDRERIVDPPAAGRRVDLLGAPAQRWSYAEDDHTVIRQVRGGSFLEVRGSGLALPAFLDLLERLRWVDEATFEAALPEAFVTEAERPAEVERHLDGIRVALGTDLPLLPDGAPPVTSDAADPYSLGVEVADAVACAWLTTYHRADGDGPESRTATDVLATMRDWPVLAELAETGDYSSGPWSLADELAAGGTPAGWAERLGCGL